MKRSLLFLTLILIGSSMNTAQTTNPVSHEVQFDYYSSTLGHWFNLTMNDNSYSISSDDDQYDGFNSDVNYFNWYEFENDASDGGFFQLDQTEDNPNFILTFTRLEQTNTISVQQIPVTFDVADGWIKMLYDIFGFQQRILLIDYDQFVWPVATQISIMESYPEQYGLSVLFQRGNDGTFCCFSQNVSLFVGVDFDINNIEEWMQNSTYSDSVYVEMFDLGTTTAVSFPSFFLRMGNHIEIEAYPLDRVTIMIILDNGMALLTSFGEGFKDFVFQTDINEPTKFIHDYIPYISISGNTDVDDKDEETDGVLTLPIPLFSILIGLIVTKLIISRKIRSI